MKYKIQTSNILGLPLSKNEEYTIVGAGISGLLLGYYLKQKGVSFQILEKSNRAGGLVYSQSIEGFGPAEEAANGFIWCEEIAEMSKTIGLTIQSPDVKSKARYLVRNNQLRKFPLGIFETFGMISKAVLPHDQKLETLEDFGHTFFGHAFTQQIMSPGIAGIYGAPIDQLSFEGVLKVIAEEMNETSSLINVLRRLKKKSQRNPNKLAGTQSFKGGFGEFPKQLAFYLKDHITYDVEVKEINGPTVITSPAYITKDLMPPSFYALLDQVKYTAFIITTLFVRRTDLHKFKAGFGCLIPRNEGLTILGVLFNSCIFPDRSIQEDLISLTCMIRDEGDGTIINLENDQIINQIIQPDLQQLLGLKGPIEAFHMKKWPKGIPIYHPNLVNAWFQLDQQLKTETPHIRLLGNYTGQISIRGMAQHIKKALNVI